MTARGAESAPHNGARVKDDPLCMWLLGPVSDRWSTMVKTYTSSDIKTYIITDQTISLCEPVHHEYEYIYIHYVAALVSMRRFIAREYCRWLIAVRSAGTALYSAGALEQKRLLPASVLDLGT